MTPFAKILVGFDGSSRSADAARQAAELARQAGARVVLVHVASALEELAGVPDPVARGYRRVMAGRHAEARRQLEAMRAQLASLRVDVSQLAVDGFAGSALAGVAHQQHADLIVVGSHGRTGLPRLLLGSVAENTVRQAETSVLVLRGAPIGGRYQQIVVGTDFSVYAQPAIERALALATPDAVIDVVHAWRVPTGGDHGDEVEPLRAQLAALSAERGAELIGRLRDRPQRVTFQSREGDAAEVLCASADLHDAELLVLGSHGHRGLRRFVLGSVAEAVVRHAACSVLVARRA